MLFAVDKPKGISSNGLLNIIRKFANTKKVGHGGTLDPLASGVLVVAIGRESTRKLTSSIMGEKEYFAEIHLGATSETDDDEGKKTVIKIKKIPSMVDIKKVIKSFEGEILQKPPIYSALKIKGKPAYKYARQGQNIDLPKRPVLIKKIKIESYNWPILKINVTSGSGVYIRGLARDIGESLGVGGYLKNLVRTRVGDFYIDSAIKADDLKDYILQNMNAQRY